MEKAVIFARVSSTGERQSNDRQIEDLNRYANYKELKVEKIFEEKISGGKSNSDRPILMECLNYIKNNEVDTLLISEMSRLGRNTFEVQKTIAELVDSKINLYSQKENFVLLDESKQPGPCSAILIAVLATCAQLERDNISYRLNSGLKRYRENGGKTGRAVGYRKSLETKAEEYKDVIHYLKKGLSLKETAKITGRAEGTVLTIKKDFNITKPIVQA